MLEFNEKEAGPHQGVESVAPTKGNAGEVTSASVALPLPRMSPVSGRVVQAAAEQFEGHVPGMCQKVS